MLTFAPVQTALEGLPALVDRAAQALASARTSAEVLEARDAASLAYDMAKKAARLAQAKGAHDTLVAAAHRAQADALLIESQAKRRLADEYDAAQERGEVASHQNANSNQMRDGNLMTLADIGLTAKQVQEARKFRNGEEQDPGIIARTVEKALEAGEEPTRALVKRAISPYIAKRAEIDSAKTDEVLDRKDFKALRALWNKSRPGARRLFRDFLTEH